LGIATVGRACLIPQSLIIQEAQMPDKNQLDRRGFLARTARNSLGLGMGVALPTSSILGADGKIRVGLIGSGGRGQFLLQTFTDAGAEVCGVSDVYQPHLQDGLQKAAPQAKSYQDYRRLLEDKSLEAVIVATPDHWHAQMVIDAVSAGKDVYVEKPLCHSIDEGFRVVEAVRSSNRVVQVGTQRRSYGIYREAKSLLDSGKLGPVRLVTTWWLNYQNSLNTSPLKGELDWKQWLGSAPARPLDPVRFHNWYYFFDYSGGMLVGQGAHVIDAIHWFMNSTFPSAVTCTAGQLHVTGAEVPETTVINVEYPEDFLATVTIGYQAMEYSRNNDQLKQFHGDKARLDMGRESYALYLKSRETVLRPEVEKKQFGTFDGATREHVLNFLDCIRTRQNPHATVEIGLHASVVLCLAMESLQSGHRIRWDAANRKIIR
jgi:predicted dehydrogenase